MTRSRIVRRILVVALALLASVSLAPAATAAKSSTASVTVTAPVDGTSTLVGGVTMSGKASVPSGTSLYVTVDGTDVGGAVAVETRGTWQRYVYVGVVGVHELCGQVRSSAGVLASSCVSWEMLPDPSQFSLSSPYEGQLTYETVNAGGACQRGASVRLVVDDGEPVIEACHPDGYGWSHVFSGLSVGEHTLVATLLGADGSAVTSHSVTWTVRETPRPDVEITSPEDGGRGTQQQVAFAGTVTNIREYIRFSVDGYETNSLYIGAVSATQPWETTLGLPYGTHKVCATVDYYDNTTDTDCITYTVDVDPATFSVDSPTDGGTAAGPDVFLGGRCTPGTAVEVALKDGSTGTSTCSDFSTWGVYLRGVADGQHTATVTNTFDGAVVTTVTVVFTSDSTPPAAPVVVSPAPGSTITSVPVNITGTGEPLATVTVLLPDGRDYTAGYVNEDGSWQLTIDRDWFDAAGVLTGKRATVNMTFTQTDAFGRVSEPTRVTYSTRLR